MVKYISDVITELKSRSAGMQTNAEKWTNQTVTAAELDDYVKQLEAQSLKIDTAEATLQKEREAGRRLAETLTLKQKQVDSLAYGIHAEETIKLTDYGLSTRKPNSSKPIPAKAVLTSIVDDADGVGFVVTWASLTNADYYEIEKGLAANTSDLVLQPPYPFLKTTTKTTLVDDAVEKGRRYFYRVRGVNATGTGEWSEPVNRVQ